MPLAEHDPRPFFHSTVMAVSIHVPLAEHDPPGTPQCRPQRGFNSRAPRGARRSAPPLAVQQSEFQFTCPSRSTTLGRRRHLSPNSFQFTCPSRSTTECLPAETPCSGFQFTCPSRSTTPGVALRRRKGYVSIHVPLAEHDFDENFALVLLIVSIHVPLAEHDLFPGVVLYRVEGFNSRAPRGARL